MFWAYEDNAIKRYLHRQSEDSSMEIWLNRLAVMGVIEEVDWITENGKFFGIPRCCREWFIFIKLIIGEDNPLLITDKEFGDDRFQEMFDYVRCPECRREF